MYSRFLASAIRDALADTPVVLLGGARQTGKTTLAQSLVGAKFPARYLTLDDATTLAAAKSDPTSFVADLGSGPIILDEVQHGAPELFPAIKANVDRDRRPGRFLLTGSANVLLLPRLSESLAGRMEIITLWPLSQAEIEAGSNGNVPVVSNVIDNLFRSGNLPTHSPFDTGSRDELLERLLRSGYPEPLARTQPTRRRAWFNAYLTTILQRDVREMANIEGLNILPRLLALLASRTASLLNLSDVATSIGIPYATLHRYMSLLEATYLIQTLPAWSNNIGTRFAKAPKLVLADTGLAANLLGLDAARLTLDPNMLGQLLETFVVMEFRKQSGWSEVHPSLFHFRTTDRQEVDLVLEGLGGQIVGIEVKASSTVTSGDFKGLRVLAELAGADRFVRGIVLYTGDQVLSFGPNLTALPLRALWQSD